MDNKELDLIIALIIALAGLAQTVVNIAFKLRQDALQGDHEQLAQDLKDFAHQLEDCLNGTSDKQVH